MVKKAFITGIAGQDGSYLSEYLVSLGYEVHGMVRRNSTPEHQFTRIDFNKLGIKTYYGDMQDMESIRKLLKQIMPDEIYNLAAQSHVRISTEIPHSTCEINAIGVLNILNAYKDICPNAKFYQASSSEMFGNTVDDDGYQRLTTSMNPVSPYGCAKLFAFNISKHFRNAYKLHICNGILFNHESPRRGSNFVTNKVVKAAVRIKYGLQDKLELGNMDSYRDWGHSKDYVKAMHKILNYPETREWIVATGETNSIRRLCEYTFSKLGLDYKDYVVQNPEYMRPEELKYLKGDSTETREILKWEPEYTFETLIDDMINHWEKIYGN